MKKKKNGAARGRAQKTNARNNNIPKIGNQSGTKEPLVLNTKVELPTVVTNGKDLFADLLEPDEIAVDTGRPQKMTNIFREVDRAAVLDMGHIKNILGDRFHAKAYEDKKGFRHILCCQQYMNGRFSPLMDIEQNDVIAYAYNSGETTDPGKKRKVDRIVEKVEHEYLGKFGGNIEEIFSVEDILKGFANVFPLLPVQSDDTKDLARMEFYKTVVEIAKMCSCEMVDRHKGYYPLLEEDINYMADQMNMTKLALLHKLKENGFLYLTGSSNGYQTNVRTHINNDKTTTVWRYCIWKIENLAGLEEEVSADYFDSYDF